MLRLQWQNDINPSRVSVPLLKLTLWLIPIRHHPAFIWRHSSTIRGILAGILNMQMSVWWHLEMYRTFFTKQVRLPTGGSSILQATWLLMRSTVEQPDSHVRGSSCITVVHAIKTQKELLHLALVSNGYIHSNRCLQASRGVWEIE